MEIKKNLIISRNKEIKYEIKLINELNNNFVNIVIA